MGEMGVPACVTVAGLLDRVPQTGAFHGRSLWSPSAGPEGQNQGMGLEGAFNSLLGLSTAFLTLTRLSPCAAASEFPLSKQHQSPWRRARPHDLIFMGLCLSRPHLQI